MIRLLQVIVCFAEDCAIITEKKETKVEATKEGTMPQAENDVRYAISSSITKEFGVLVAKVSLEQDLGILH